MNVNIVFFVVLLLLIGGGVKGYIRGMVEEIASVLGLLLALLAIGMFIVAARGYIERQTVWSVLGIASMVIAIVIYRITDFIFSSLKMVAKIPVIHGLDKCMGFIVGGIEAVLLVWIGFIIIVAFDFGGASRFILTGIHENAFLTFLFQNNYLAEVIAGSLPSALP